MADWVVLAGNTFWDYWRWQMGETRVGAQSRSFFVKVYGDMLVESFPGLICSQSSLGKNFPVTDCWY